MSNTLWDTAHALYSYRRYLNNLLKLRFDGSADSQLAARVVLQSSIYGVYLLSGSRLTMYLNNVPKLATKTRAV